MSVLERATDVFELPRAIHFDAPDSFLQRPPLGVNLVNRNWRRSCTKITLASASTEPIAPSDGNVFTTVDYGMSTHGGFGLPGEPKAHRKYIVAALVTGLAAGVWLFRK